jgi:hypothetical protein
MTGTLMQQPNVSVVDSPYMSAGRRLGTRFCMLVVSSTLALDGYPADVTVRWDYTQSGAAGFALHCGSAANSYTSRTDVGNTDTFSFSVPDGQVTFCAVTAYDPAGMESPFSNELALSVSPDTRTVTNRPPISVSVQGGRAIPTATGVRLVFNLPFDPRRLNLYGSQAGLEGPADLTLVGATTGAVRGSLVLDADNQAFTFVKTGGVLVPDTYTLTVASRWDSVVDVYGRPIDGNGLGVTGDDYRLTFAVTARDTPILSIGEFARGPGQTVNLPATDQAAGIPIRILNGASVSEVAFTLRYNPTLLTVQDVSLRSQAGVLTLKSIDQSAGLVRVHVANLTGLRGDSSVLLTLQAQVPANAPYRGQHVLDLDELVFNGGTLGGRADDGLHVVAYPGDTNGDGVYTSLDPQLIQRVILRVDTGFSAYPLTDPAVLADINGNGRLDSSDALLVQLKALRQVVPEIPE